MISPGDSDNDDNKPPTVKNPPPPAPTPPRPPKEVYPAPRQRRNGSHFQLTSPRHTQDSTLTSSPSPPPPRRDDREDDIDEEDVVGDIGEEPPDSEPSSGNSGQVVESSTTGAPSVSNGSNNEHITECATVWSIVSFVISSFFLAMHMQTGDQIYTFFYGYVLLPTCLNRPLHLTCAQTEEKRPTVRTWHPFSSSSFPSRLAARFSPFLATYGTRTWNQMNFFSSSALLCG